MNDMASGGGGSPNVTVKEVVVDPRWSGLYVTLDGHPKLVLRLEHPRHGAIDALLTRSSAVALRDWLTGVLAEAAGGA